MNELMADLRLCEKLVQMPRQGQTETASRPPFRDAGRH